GNTKATVRGVEKELLVPPSVINDRTMVPLRFIGEAFQANFNYSPSEYKASVELNGDNMQLWMGKSTAIINAREVQLDTPPVILNGAMLVPIRSISEHFNFKVDYEQSTRTVTISESTGPKPVEPVKPDPSEPTELMPVEPTKPDPIEQIDDPKPAVELEYN